MSNASTTPATPAAKRKLPAPLTNEQIHNLKVGDHVAARESGKVYQITEVTPEGLKGRAFDMLSGTLTGPTRPLVGKNLTGVGPSAPAVAPVPDPATVAANGPAAKLAAQKTDTKVTTIDAGGGIGVDVIEKQPVTPTVAPAPKNPEPKQEVKPKQAKKVYKLEITGRTTRYERVTPELITLVRNPERERGNNQGRWVEVAEADVPRGFTINEPPTYTPAERAALAAIGRQKDEEFMSKREQQKAEKSDKKDRADAETTEKTSGKKTEKKAKAKAERPEYHGVGMCEFLRYAGSKGWDKKVTKIVAEKVGFSPSPTTIHIQTKKGENGENVPTMPKDARNELKTFVDEAKTQVAEEKAAKAEKKSDKKESKKSGGKASGKKKAAKKAEQEDDEDAEEEDDAKAEVEAADDEEDDAEEEVEDAEDDSDDED